MELVMRCNMLAGVSRQMGWLFQLQVCGGKAQQLSWSCCSRFDINNVDTTHKHGEEIQGIRAWSQRFGHEDNCNIEV